MLVCLVDLVVLPLSYSSKHLPPSFPVCVCEVLLCVGDVFRVWRTVCGEKVVFLARVLCVVSSCVRVWISFVCLLEGGTYKQYYISKEHICIIYNNEGHAWTRTHTHTHSMGVWFSNKKDVFVVIVVVVWWWWRFD